MELKRQIMLRAWTFSYQPESISRQRKARGLSKTFCLPKRDPRSNRPRPGEKSERF